MPRTSLSFVIKAIFYCHLSLRPWMNGVSFWFYFSSLFIYILKFESCLFLPFYPPPNRRIIRESSSAFPGLLHKGRMIGMLMTNDLNDKWQMTNDKKRPSPVISDVLRNPFFSLSFRTKWEICSRKWMHSDASLRSAWQLDRWPKGFGQAPPTDGPSENCLPLSPVCSTKEEW